MPVKFDVNAIVKRVKGQVAKGVLATADWVKSEASRRIIEPPKTGVIYAGAPFRVGKPPHQASAPGEAPAEDTGALRQSGKAEYVGDLQAEVTFNAGYARNLEYGIPSNDDYPLEARPFLKPSVLEGKKRVTEFISKEMMR